MSGSAVSRDESHAYDAVGNRVRLTQAPGLPEERTNTFDYDRDNRLTATVDADLKFGFTLGEDQATARDQALAAIAQVAAS